MGQTGERKLRIGRVFSLIEAAKVRSRSRSVETVVVIENSHPHELFPEAWKTNQLASIEGAKASGSFGWRAFGGVDDLSPFLVGTFGGAHPDPFAFVDERRNLHHQTGLELRRLRHV